MSNNNSIPLPVLRDDNPYATGSVAVFKDGSVALDPGDFNYIKSQGDRYYTVIDEENLNSISYQAYGNAKLWWVLAKANNLFSPFDLESGLTLLVPDIKTMQIANL